MNQNPALGPFAFLVGEWKVTGTHPYMPGVELRGKAKMEWIEDGAFLMMRAHIDDERFPKGVSIFGSDNAANEYYMLYYDERGVSRKYDVTLHETGVAWSRNDPELSQRVHVSLQRDGTIVTKGEMSQKGGEWGPDLSQTLTRSILKE